MLLNVVPIMSLQLVRSFGRSFLLLLVLADCIRDIHQSIHIICSRSFRSFGINHVYLPTCLEIQVSYFILIWNKIGLNDYVITGVILYLVYLSVSYII